MNWNCNMGEFDRTLRLTFGTGIMVVAGLYASPLALVGVAMIATGLMHWCPLYGVLRMNTIEKKAA